MIRTGRSSELRAQVYRILAVALDRYLPRFVQEIVRLSLLNLFLPAINGVLFSKRKAWLEPRGSVLQRFGFRVQWSDLDLAVILKGNQSYSKFMNRTRFLKNLFPFVGEIEVYTEIEWKQRSDLLKGSASISILRPLRKISWELDKLNSTGIHEYHRLKSTRSLNRVAESLGFTEFARVNWGKALEPLLFLFGGQLRNQIENEVRQISESFFNKKFYFEYLGLSLVAQRGNDVQLNPVGKVLNASLELFVALLLITPNADLAAPDIFNRLRFLRKSDPIRKSFREICEFEILTLRSDYRIGKYQKQQFESYLKFYEALVLENAT